MKWMYEAEYDALFSCHTPLGHQVGLKMLKSKFLCYSLTFLTFVFCCIVETSNAQSLTVEQANSCNGCLKSDGVDNMWCYSSEYQGCICKAQIPTCPHQSSAVTECTDLPEVQRFANCNGCTEAGKTWCVIKFPNANSSVESKCIEKVNDADLSKVRTDCLNGKMYNKCIQTMSSDDEIPEAMDLNPLPVYRTCFSCVEQESTGWCVSSKRTAGVHYGLSQYCTDEEDECDVAFAHYHEDCLGLPEEQLHFKYFYAPHNCKACPQRDHCLSQTCNSCTADGDKWCIAGNVAKDEVMVPRMCISESDDDECPPGSQRIDKEMCKTLSAKNRFTYLPEVPQQNLPTSCLQCTGDNAWCRSSDGNVRTCLPKRVLGFLCPESGLGASCPSSNEERLFINNPSSGLPESCNDCVKDNQWCIAFVHREIYQFCIPLGSLGVCIGGNPVRDCSNLSVAQKVTSFPKTTKTCDDCINKGFDYVWCVENYYGEKRILCLPKQIADVVCSRGVAFNHCQIAPEDRTATAK